jgi:hypothetical protein
VTKIRKDSSKNIRINKAYEAFSIGEYPTFSFRYLTTNKNYNLEYFNDMHKAREASYFLIFKLTESSQHKISELLSWNKKRGFETIPHGRFRHKILVEGFALPDDAKLHILRFGNQDYRVIFFKQPDISNLFHVVMLDFNHSAYDHD